MAGEEHIFMALDFGSGIEVREEVVAELTKRLSSTSLDTREVLASYVPDADDFQRRVIAATGRTLRVVAPAGSGKTQTVVNRVLSKIREGLAPKRILVLTFDTSAVRSINGKMAEQLDTMGAQIDLPTIRTLNAFGYGVLKELAPGEFKQVAQDYRERRLLREVKEALGHKSPHRASVIPTELQDGFFLEFFSLLKNELFDPRKPATQRLADFVISRKQAEPLFGEGTQTETVRAVVEAVIWMYMAYELALQREQLMDFDDQKLRPFALLQSDRRLLEVVRNRYSEIIVDEFQDINRLDFELIKLIAVEASLLAFGDDDQAIYGFRGCTPDFIMNLEERLGRTVESYELSINYRCPANLVSAADRLIRHNALRVDKQPLAKRKENASIKVVSALSAGVEARLIVSTIERLRRAKPGMGHQDFAVLYRANAQSLPIQIEFILNSIPYLVRDQDNILTNQVLERLLGILRVKLALEAGHVPDPKDCVSSVQAYFRYVSPDQASRLYDLFRSFPKYAEAISSEMFYEVLPKAAQSHISSAIREVIQAKTLMNTLDVLAKSFRGLKGMIGSLEDVVEERVPLGEVYELAANFKGKTRDFVDTMERALDLARKTSAGKAEENGTRLLTYFKAKGLQWHTVIMTSCNEGIIPHRKAPVEDERRLFYVGMTRATSNLFLFYLKNSCNNKVAPSRFLAEAGLLP